MAWRLHSSSASAAFPPECDTQPSRVRVSLLPVVEEYTHRTLHKVVTVDEPAMTIFDFKQRLARLLTHPQKEFSVPSLFVVRQPLPRTATADTIRDLAMRRENYLRVHDTVAACFVGSPEPSDGVHVDVVALVIAPEFGWGLDVEWYAETLEQLMLSEITDRTLPPTLTSSTPSFIRDDDVRMYSVISELLELRGQQEGVNSELHEQSEFHGVVVTGSPGVGTTTFLWFLLSQLSRTHTVVLDVPGFFLLIRPDGTVIRGADNRRSFGHELCHPGTIYLADKNAANADSFWNWIHGRSVVIAACDCELLEQLHDNWSEATTLYMPPWSLSDLIERRRRVYEDAVVELSTEEVAMLYDHFGGLPGDVVHVNDSDSLHAMIHSLQSAIGQLEPDHVHKLWSDAGKEFWFYKLPDEGFYLELMHVTPSSDFRRCRWSLRRISWGVKWRGDARQGSEKIIQLQ